MPSRKFLKYAWKILVECGEPIRWDTLIMSPFGANLQQPFDKLFCMFDEQKLIANICIYRIWTNSNVCVCVVRLLVKHAHYHKILNNRSPETNTKLHLTIINGVCYFCSPQVLLLLIVCAVSYAVGFFLYKLFHVFFFVSIWNWMSYRCYVLVMHLLHSLSLILS